MKTISTVSRIVPALLLALFLAACSDDSGTSSSSGKGKLEPARAPAFLKRGDKVALLSPSYSTPDSNVRKTADVLRKWGYEPVIGAHVGEIHAGKTFE